jgi:hypothetical protein
MQAGGWMKPLDFVKTRKGNLGMITEVSTCQGNLTASVAFLGTFEGEKTAWWGADELEVVDNLPDLLSRNLNHPFGTGSLQPFKMVNE